MTRWTPETDLIYFLKFLERCRDIHLPARKLLAEILVATHVLLISFLIDVFVLYEFHFCNDHSGVSNDIDR